MSVEMSGSWRKAFDFRFLSGEDLTKEVVLTIDSVIKEMVQHQNGKEEVLALKFVETPKMMAVNKTNAKTISKIVGSPLTELWKGKKVILQQKKVKAFGGDHLAIRIKMQKV